MLNILFWPTKIFKFSNYTKNEYMQCFIIKTAIIITIDDQSSTFKLSVRRMDLKCYIIEITTNKPNIIFFSIVYCHSIMSAYFIKAISIIKVLFYCYRDIRRKTTGELQITRITRKRESKIVI